MNLSCSTVHSPYIIEQLLRWTPVARTERAAQTEDAIKLWQPGCVDIEGDLKKGEFVCANAFKC